MFVCKTSLEWYKKISIYSDHDWHFSFHGSEVSREKAAWAVILLVVCRERMSVGGNVCVRAQWDYKPLLHEASVYRIYSSSEVCQSLLSILVWHLLLTVLFLWIVLIFSFYLLSTVKKISFFLVSYYSAWHIVGALLLHMGCVLKLPMHSGWTSDPGLVLSWICLRRSSSGLTCWSRGNEFWLVLGPRSLL